MQELFEKLLKETMGLDAATVGSAAVASAIRARMTNLGLQFFEEYWELVSASNEELEELIEMVVVPETWFFRDEDAFVALGRLLSIQCHSNQPIRTLRLLSAPCCSGEEPYSMVMALLEAGFSSEQVRVDAVDISRRSLNRAALGIYGPNAFRGGNIGFRDRNFDQTPAGYRILDTIRKPVSFHRGNLLAPNFCPFGANYDAIFCRNVLIYFDSETQKRVLRILGSLLAERGLLFVGPAEAFLAACNGFTSINESMSFAFRKQEAFAPQVSAKLNWKTAPAEKRLVRMEASDIAISLPSPLVTRVVSSDQSIETIRQLADSGRLGDAANLCNDYLKVHGDSISALYLQALIRDALGDAKLSEESYRKVLYLDPAHNEALTHLALLLEKRGDKSQAKRLRDRVRRTETVAAS